MAEDDFHAFHHLPILLLISRHNHREINFWRLFNCVKAIFGGIFRN